MIKIWLTLALLSISACGGKEMGMTDIGKICLFSKMSGVVLLDGKPAANARLVRTVDFTGAKTDETHTDANGYFEFPAVFQRSIAKHLPQEFASNQTIVAFYQDKEYAMWTGVKRKPEENSEARGKELIVKCELNQEEKLIKVNNSPIFSLCTWDVEPDKKRKAF